MAPYSFLHGRMCSRPLPPGLSKRRAAAVRPWPPRHRVLKASLPAAAALRRGPAFPCRGGSFREKTGRGAAHSLFGCSLVHTCDFRKKKANGSPGRKRVFGLLPLLGGQIKIFPVPPRRTLIFAEGSGPRLDSDSQPPSDNSHRSPCRDGRPGAFSHCGSGYNPPAPWRFPGLRNCRLQ